MLKRVITCVLLLTVVVSIAYADYYPTESLVKSLVENNTDYLVGGPEDTGSGGGGGVIADCQGTMSSWSVVDSGTATLNEYKFLAGMSATSFVLKEENVLEWWNLSGTTPSQLGGAGTVVVSDASVGVCKLDSDTVAVLNNNLDKLEAWDHDGDGTFTEDTAAETTLTIDAQANCTYLADNKIFVHYNGVSGATYTYSAGSGFTQEGNILTLDVNSRTVVEGLSETRIAEHITNGASTQINIYDFSSPNWTQTGNSNTSVNTQAAGQFGICPVTNTQYAEMGKETQDEITGWVFDGTNHTTEGTALSDPATYWSSWPQICVKLEGTRFATATWGETEIAILDLTCSG